MLGNRINRVLVVLPVLIMAGCSQYGQTTEPIRRTTRVTFAQLQDNWGKYLIYYSTRIVVFDPIADDKTVQVHGDWNLIEAAEKLSEIFSRLMLNPRFDSEEIFEIQGPGGDLFGYMIFASGDLVSIKAVGANTVRLNYNPQRTPDAP